MRKSEPGVLISFEHFPDDIKYTQGVLVLNDIQPSFQFAVVDTLVPVRVHVGARLQQAHLDQDHPQRVNSRFGALGSTLSNEPEFFRRQVHVFGVVFHPYGLEVGGSGKEVGVNDLGDGEVGLSEAEVNVVEADFVVGDFELFESSVSADGTGHDNVDLLSSEGFVLLLPVDVLGLKVDENVVEEEQELELVTENAVSLFFNRV